MANKDKELVLDNPSDNHAGDNRDRVTFRQIAKFAIKRLKFRDRFNPAKIAIAALVTQDIMFGMIDEDKLPKNPNWKFSFPNNSKKKGR